MRIELISPEEDDPREVGVLAGLFASGLLRYHVRKPAWSRSRLEAWLRGLPKAWRPRLILHEHHGLARELGLGGIHHKDTGAVPAAAPDRSLSEGRSCHDLPTLERILGSFDTVIFGPVFPSITKVGYGPREGFPWDELTRLLTGRSGSCQVLAIGGITPEGLPRCAALGFDGVAALGTVWADPDPVAAFSRLLTAANPSSNSREEAHAHAHAR